MAQPKMNPPEDLFTTTTANPGSNGAGVIPFPNPAGQTQAGTPPAANIPDAPAANLGTDVPLPSTVPTGSQVEVPESPGALLSADNLDLESFADKAPGVTPEQTVQGQLEGLLSNREMNPLWQYAEGLGKQYANSRGLLNSSIAAEAGAQAIFQQAVPIAAQDANTHAARAQQLAGFWQSAGLQAQQGTIASTLSAQDHMQQLVQTALQGDINSRLQLEQFGYNFQLNEQQNLHNMQLAALQGDIQAALALQKFGFDVELMKQDFGFRVQLMDTELRNALQLGEQQQDHQLEQMALSHRNALEQIGANAEANMDIQAAAFARDLQQNYLLAVERRTQQFSSEVQSIYQQQGLSAAQQTNAVNVARANYLADIQFIQLQYSTSPNWDPNWGTTGSPTPGGGGFPGTGGTPGGTPGITPGGPGPRDNPVTPRIPPPGPQPGTGLPPQPGARPPLPPPIVPGTGRPGDGDLIPREDIRDPDQDR